MPQSENISYSEIHAYMLKKTQEYYKNPPEFLVNAVIAMCRDQGAEISYSDAKKRVSLIDIQRYIKREMQDKWPEFMNTIPSNSLRED